MIFYLDADLAGPEDFNEDVDHGFLKYFRISNINQYEETMLGLLPVATPADTVVVDTITTLANNIRGDLKLGPDAGELYGKRGVYFGDKNYLTVFEAAQQMIMRHIKNLRDRGVKIIIVCHENERKDEITLDKQRAPAVNDALYKSMVGSATHMCRLTISHGDELDTEGNVKFKKGTRFLHLRTTEEMVAKFRTDRDLADSIPDRIPNPTMRALRKCMNRQIGFFVLYGAFGSGKTTLAKSDSYLEIRKAKKAAEATAPKETVAEGETVDVAKDVAPASNEATN